MPSKNNKETCYDTIKFPLFLILWIKLIVGVREILRIIQNLRKRGVFKNNRELLLLFTHFFWTRKLSLLLWDSSGHFWPIFSKSLAVAPVLWLCSSVTWWQAHLHTVWTLGTFMSSVTIHRLILPWWSHIIFVCSLN